MGKKVTIQDIADALGISRNTVSKAINNSGGLAEATREKILQKAVEMGYKQFSYMKAVSGISGASGAPGAPGAPRETEDGPREIALLTTAFLGHSHFASVMLDSFQQEISELGYTLNTHRVSAENRKALTLPATFRKERAAAVLCIEVFDRAYADMVCALGLPALFVDGPAVCCTPALPADQLYMDNSAETARFVGDMLRRGKRRIGFIGNHEHCQSFFERYATFRCSMLLSGAPVREEDCVKSNDRDEIAAGIRAMESLPDVFLCANDFLAMDVIQAVRELGKSVPEDVWVCGFDDAPESRFISPPLTTIHIHTQIMAFSAVHLLMSRIREPNLDYRVMHTQTDLIYRASTGDREEGRP